MNKMQLVSLTDMDKIKSTYEVYKYCMYMPTKEKFDKKIAEWMSDGKIQIYGCICNGSIRGMIVLLLLSDENAEILGISVDENYRGNGVATYMICEVCAKHSLKVLNAETDDDAVVFYQRMGFEVTKKIKIYKDCEVVRYECILRRKL